jgi:hypothetical protein
MAGNLTMVAGNLTMVAVHRITAVIQTMAATHPLQSLLQASTLKSLLSISI